MFCPLCGNCIDSISSICNYCSNKIFNTCFQCGCMNLYNSKHKYCVDCGANLAERKKRQTVKDKVDEKYGDELRKIKTFISAVDGYISYQQIAEYLGLESCYDRINPEDEKSTVGYLIYLARIRELGYDVKVLSAKYSQNKTNDQTSFIMRYIGPKGNQFEYNEQIVLKELKKAYCIINLDERTFESLALK